MNSVAGTTTRRPTDDVHWLNLMSAVPDTVIVSDPQGLIVYANPAVERFFGYKPEQLLGQAVEILVPSQFHTRHKAHRNSYHAEPRRRSMGFGADLAAMHRDGSKVPVAISLGYTRTENGNLVIAIIQDLTELRKRDRSIDELNEGMVRDAELRELNKELEAFAFSVSHDLRAPLRTIDGFAQILQEEYADRLGDHGKNCTERIRLSAQRMGQLIDDMLKLSRITRAELVVKYVDVSAMAQEIADSLRARNPKRDVEFIIADEMKLHGDANLLRIALDNLIRNAWKFTSRRSPARIEIGQTEHDGMTVTYVRDNGVGFDMAHTDKLFGAFQRLHNAREFPGSGIGLATVQRVINRHTGQVWASAEPDRGATFYFTLYQGGRDAKKQDIAC